jgi:hypothetical protein
MVKLSARWDVFDFISDKLILTLTRITVFQKTPKSFVYNSFRAGKNELIRFQHNMYKTC